jgi:ATP-dependent Clp protease adaptor protein ClpS
LGGDGFSLHANLLSHLCKCLVNAILTASADGTAVSFMSDTDLKPRAKARPKIERPKLYKVLLINDDFTPRDFVVTVLKAVFRISDDQAYRVMITAHRKGSCVVAVYTRDIAETKATEGTDAGKQAGYPLMFSTEPEE